jgi:hypothetical protein
MQWTDVLGRDETVASIPNAVSPKPAVRLDDLRANVPVPPLEESAASLITTFAPPA